MADDDATTTTTTNCDVVVLGGGVAGLAAARTLRAAGLSLAMVEARGRLGGRVYTVRDPSLGLPVELGAEFMHGDPEVLRPIVRAAGIRRCDVAERHQVRRDVEPGPPDDEVWSTIEAFTRAAREARAGGDVSVADFLAELTAREPRFRSAAPMITTYVSGFHAADPRRMSVAALVREEDAGGDGPDARPIDGYDALVRWLAAGLDPLGDRVLLDCVATEVRWRAGGPVTVACATREGTPRGLVRATHGAVVALPLGVLQAGAVRFDPAPRATLDAAAKLAVGHVVRTVLRFREAFWESLPLEGNRGDDEAEHGGRNLGFLHDPAADVPTFWTQLPVRVPLVTAWAGGPFADALATLSHAELLDRTLSAFAHALKRPRAEVDAQFEGAHHHPWHSDPYARGAYSYVPVGALDATEALARPVEGTLFFAGEATHVGGGSGTVHGAIETGQRAARELLEALAARRG